MSAVRVDVQIPLNDLSRGTASLRVELDAAIARVLESGWFILGPENEAFEAELSAYLGVEHSVLVGNGTDALQIALTALGVAEGDTVMTVANAGGYTSTAVRSLGALPSYVDIEPENHLMSLRTFEAALSAAPVRPKVVVVTHLYGAVVDTTPIVRRAHELGISVLEDCAQSLGASFDGQKSGTFGDVATSSFYPTKNFGALGDGGGIHTSNAEVAARLRQLRQYGWESKYRATVTGGRNSRLDEMQAAVLRAKLPHLDGWNRRRREIHREYERAVGSGARLIGSSDDEGFIGHLAVLDVENRSRAKEILRTAGIKTDVHYPIPDHLQPLVAGESSPLLAVTERAAEHVLSIPLFQDLRTDEIERVCAALNEL